MYPEKLEKEKIIDYWYDKSIFDEWNFVLTYLHKNYQNKMHAHQFYEINIVMNGQGRHYIEDTSIKAGVGDVFVIPPEINHGYYSKGNIDIYHILIKTDFFKRYSEELNQIKCFDLMFDIEPLLRRASGANLNLRLDYNEMSIIYNLLKKINKAGKDKMFMYQNILALEFIFNLSFLYENKVLNNELESNENIELISALEYIKNNLGNKIILEDIANYCNVSTATLNRRFKKAINLSPMAYLLKSRISKAKELLESGLLNKAEIAQQCGFYDSAHLNKYLEK